MNGIEEPLTIENRIKIIVDATGLVGYLRDQLEDSIKRSE